MGDQTEEDHASNSKEKVNTIRNKSFDLSSDSLPDDTIKTKTKNDYGIITKSDSKPLVSRFNILLPFNLGQGKHNKQGHPGKPFVKYVSSDSVHIEWDAAYDFTKGDVYQVSIKNNEHTEWYSHTFEINRGEIGGLKPSTSYTFSVRLVKGNGEQFKNGESSEVVTTKEEPIPGKPSVQRVLADRVDIIWKRVDTFCKGDAYEVHVENIHTKNTFCKTFDQNSANIEDLQPDSPYVFKVRLVEKNGKVSKYSDNSDRVKTCSTFASTLIRTRCRVDTSDKGLDLYELPLDIVQHATHADASSIKYEIGPKRMDVVVEKTIMLLGETGTGKTTFVDSLANYILSVRLEDPYRFTVTKKEDREKQKCQATSQTDWITSYTFNPQEGTRLTYRLNVIDMPGFGDTRGAKRDKEIMDQIHQLFKLPGETGVQTIDAVCFFVKASDARLTPRRSQIFSAIQSLFGKDIKGNICLLITFADSSVPVVEHAVKTFGLPYGKSFSFNNLPWSSDPKVNLTSEFWKMNLNRFTALFNHLDTLETKSLQLTKEVLKERHHLEVTCVNLLIKIKDKISVIKCMEEERKILQKNHDEIEKNKNFTYKVGEIKVIRVDLSPNERATNCLTCKTTCHRNCSTIFENFPRMCWAVNWVSGNCKQCHQRCHWSEHETSCYRFNTIEETVEKTCSLKLKKNQDATKKYLTVSCLIEEKRSDKNKYKLQIEEMLKEIMQCKKRLNEIGLSPYQISMKEEIKQLIKTESSEGKPGFQDRIIQLEKLWKRDIGSDS